MGLFQRYLKVTQALFYILILQGVGAPSGALQLITNDKPRFFLAKVASSNNFTSLLIRFVSIPDQKIQKNIKEKKENILLFQ